MSFFLSLQSIWIIAILVLTFIKFKWSIALYLAYFFLVPYLNLHILGIDINWNNINLILLAGLVFYHNKGNRQTITNLGPIVPFIIYFGVTLLLIPFQDSMPFSIQLAYWRSTALSTLSLPFIVWYLVKDDPKSLALFRNVTVVCIVIIIIYGAVLTTFGGLNPYTMMLSTINGIDYRENYLSAETTERMFGRITSVFSHPMTFGLFLGLSMVYVFAIEKNIKRWIVWGIIGLIVFDAFVCGVRTSIVSIIVAASVYLFYHRSFKLMALSAVFLLIGFIIVSRIPELYAYIESITNSDSSEVQGSSVSMRVSQFYGCLKEVQNHLLEGRGFSWTNYYVSTNGSHPPCWSFESLVFYLLCNSGIIGIVLWIFVVKKIFKLNNRMQLESKSILNTLISLYLIYTLITGEYGYMKYYLLFSTLLYAEFLSVNSGE